MDVSDPPGLRTLHEPMPNLLVTTPDYLLRYDVDTRQVFVVDTGRPEYYGVSWHAGAGGVYLSHSGLNNNALRSVEDYANSERGYVSLGQEGSWNFLSAPHQILCVGPDRVVATNTGRNCVTVANTGDWSIRHHRFDEVLWDRLGEADRSGSHFNSVFARDGLLYVVAHNFDKGSYTLKLEWPGLRPIETMQHRVSGIHNLWVRDDGMMLSCDTMGHGLISLGDDRRVWDCCDPACLTRGLAATTDRLYVGASTNGGRADRRSGETGLWVVDAGSFATLDYHSLGRFGGVHEVRLLDVFDLCHPQGPVTMSPHLAGTPPNLFASRRKLDEVTVRARIWEAWEIVEGDVSGEAAALTLGRERQVIALRRGARGATFRIAAVLDLSDPKAENCALVGRYRGPGDANMVAAILHRPPAGRAVLGLWRHDGTTWECLGTHDPKSLHPLVELVGEGSRFTVRCDGTGAMTVEDRHAPADGRVGLRGIGGVARVIECEVDGVRIPFAETVPVG